MAQYIDKAALVAEIERLEGLNNCGTSDFIEAKRIAFGQVRQAINTLEVKEMDVEEEKDSYVKIHKNIFTSVCQAILDGDDD